MARRPSRRDIIALSTLGAAVLQMASVRAAQSRRKPNLLFIWTDEQRADTMAAYGNRKIHAPNLNKLASESVIFERGYVSQPVCTPSRSTVMTGLWPHASGLTANNIPLPTETRCLPELLGDGGYRTAYMGKWHLGDEIFAQHGFAEWVSMEDGYRKHYRPGRDRSARSDYHRFLLEKGYAPAEDGTFSRAFAARRPIEHCKPKFLEQKACEFLRRHRDKPFMLYINFLEPHMPFFGPLDAEHDPDEIDLPGNFADPLEENEPLRYRTLRERHRARYGTDEQSIRKLIARYYGLVTQVDLSVGAILKTLDDLGLAEDTIVVYTSDHGDMMGSHHMVEKSVMYEEAVRVPWLMRIPRMKGGSKRVGQPVSHIDMVPTLLDLMGAKSRPALPGQSLVPLILGKRVGEDHVFIEWNPGAGATQKVEGADVSAAEEERRRVAGERTRSIIAPDGWKLCLSDKDKCQLFNLKQDPGETRNLFDSGRYSEVIGRLSKRIRRWQERTGDAVELPT
ncbi:MAG: sulfatase-like hydrolase/transferase [Phycisphaerae bacterium]|nr:sulfatase-like hydrolase/transferase [Phycisphaerae bacterium]